MQPKLLSFLAAAIVSVMTIALAPSRATAEAVTSFELTNGLTVVVVPDKRLPVVTHMVFYRVGSTDEPRGKSGLAPLLEHLMFKATDRIASGEFARVISRIGGNDNAITGADTTYYYQRVAKRHIHRVMQLEADRMLGLKLDAMEIKTELDVVAEERRLRIESEPVAILSEQMVSILYANHPYRISGFGWPHELAALTKADAETFYRQHYAPNAAVVVVAGDVTEQEVRDLAHATYGALPARKLAERVRITEPAPRAARRVVMYEPRTPTATMARMYATVSDVTATGNEAEALEVLARVLGSGDTSRLAEALILQSKKARAAAAIYSANARDGGRFTVFAVPAPGIAPGDIEADLDAVILKLLADGPTEAEVEQARAGARAKMVFDADSQFERAKRIGESMAHGLPLAHINAGEARLASVTRDDVVLAARKHLRLVASVTGWVLPEAVPSAKAQ